MMDWIPTILFPKTVGLERTRSRAIRVLAAALLTVLPSGAFAQAPQGEEIPPIRPLRTGGLKAEVAALIMSGQQGGAIPLEVLVLPFTGEGGEVRIPLVIEIGGEGLVGDHHDGPLRFEIYAYALSESGGLKGSLLQTFEVDRKRLERDPASGGVKFFGEMTLEPGKYSLRVLIRRSGENQVGVRSIPLEVPKPGESPAGPSFSKPLIADHSPSWLRLEEVRGGGRRLPPRPPHLQELPAARAVIAPDREVPFRLLAKGLDSVGSQMEVEIEGAGGRRVTGLPASISADRAAGEGSRVLEGVFRADGLVNGHYHLRLVMQGPEGRLESPPLPIVVLEPEKESALPRAWSEITPEMLAAQASEVNAVLGARSGENRRKRKKQKIPVEPIQEGYEKALDHLAKGNASLARAELFRHALSIMQKHGSEGLQILYQVEVLNANQVAEKAPEALLPLALLHHDLYRYARQRDVSLISTHARTSTLGMAELYVDHSRSPSASGLAADIFASIGSALLEASLNRFSERLFRRALDLEENHDLSLLSLGMSYESLGDYERAVDYFESLVQAHPEHYQGRLRLAINQARIFRIKAATRQYRRILEGTPEPWIKSLAYQGLAQVFMEDEEMEEAIELLEGGIQELPGEDKLFVKLAFLYDAMLQGERSRELLAAVEQATGGGGSEGESSRHRYTRGPEEAVSSLRIDLWRQAEARLGELKDVLVANGRADVRSAS